MKQFRYVLGIFGFVSSLVCMERRGGPLEQLSLVLYEDGKPVEVSESQSIINNFERMRSFLTAFKGTPIKKIQLKDVTPEMWAVAKEVFLKSRFYGVKKFDQIFENMKFLPLADMFLVYRAFSLLKPCLQQEDEYQAERFMRQSMENIIRANPKKTLDFLRQNNYSISDVLIEKCKAFSPIAFKKQVFHGHRLLKILPEKKWMLLEKDNQVIIVDDAGKIIAYMGGCLNGVEFESIHAQNLSLYYYLGASRAVYEIHEKINFIDLDTKISRCWYAHALSPDKKKIALQSKKGLIIQDTQTGDYIIAKACKGGIKWASDNAHLIVFNDFGFCILDDCGNELASREAATKSINWSFDGKSVALFDSQGLVLMDQQGIIQKKWKMEGDWNTCIRWIHDNNHIGVFTSDGITLVNIINNNITTYLINRDERGMFLKGTIDQECQSTVWKFSRLKVLISHDEINDGIKVEFIKEPGSEIHTSSYAFHKGYIDSFSKGCFKFFALDGSVIEAKMPQDLGEVHKGAWSRNGKNFVVAFTDGVAFFDSAGTLLSSHICKNPTVYVIAWSPDNALVAVLGNHIMLFDEHGSLIKCHRNFAFSIWAPSRLQWAPDGNSFIIFNHCAFLMNREGDIIRHILRNELQLESIENCIWADAHNCFSLICKRGIALLQDNGNLHCVEIPKFNPWGEYHWFGKLLILKQYQKVSMIKLDDLKDVEGNFIEECMNIIDSTALQQ